jgi:hypothetical protein
LHEENSRLRGVLFGIGIRKLGKARIGTGGQGWHLKRHALAECWVQDDHVNSTIMGAPILGVVVGGRMKFRIPCG